MTTLKGYIEITNCFDTVHLNHNDRLLGFSLNDYKRLHIHIVEKPMQFTNGIQLRMQSLAAKGLLLLWLSTLFLPANPVHAYDAQNMAEQDDILPKDNLPDMPPAEKTAWLHSVNSRSEPEPDSVEMKQSSDTGDEAAVVPGPLTSPTIGPNGVPEEKEIAATDQLTVNGHAVNDPNEAPGAIEELTRQILLKEVALEKFNLNYKLNAAKQGRWKGWRYTAFGEANGGFRLAGGIVSLHNRGSHLHRSSGVKTYVQEDANWIQMIGNIIGASAAALEFSINELHEYQAYTKGFSPGKARQYVNSLKADINRKLSERDQLVKLEQSAPLLTGRAEIDQLEGKVLTDLRDQSLLEYQRFHLSARRLMAFQQSSYFFDLAKNVTGAIGYDFAFLSLHRHRRPWNGRAGTLFDVAGGLQILEPIGCRIFAKGASQYQKHFVHETIREAEAKETAVLEQDQKDLEAACKGGKYSTEVVGKIADRSVFYGEHSKTFQDEVLSASKQLNKAKLVAGENIGAGIFMGGTKLAAGILFNACGYQQLYNAKEGQTARRVTNHLLFAASATGMQGACFGMLDSLRIQLQGEINRHKASVRGTLPGQLIHARLNQLDAMEAKLNAGH